MPFVLILLFILSCGDNTRRNNFPDQIQEETINPFPFNQFKTRLTNSLEISGVECLGGEVLEVSGEFVCDKGDWLITVDQQNRCTSMGCTEIFVWPIIGSLTIASTTDTVIFYNIIPLIPVSDKVQDTLDAVLIRSSKEGPVVVFKDQI
jgi:hypothetical protein